MYCVYCVAGKRLLGIIYGRSGIGKSIKYVSTSNLHLRSTKPRSRRGWAFLKTAILEPQLYFCHRLNAQFYMCIPTKEATGSRSNGYIL